MESPRARQASTAMNQGAPSISTVRMLIGPAEAGNTKL
ncbi:hypothetical protein [Azospirillum palustre]